MAEAPTTGAKGPAATKGKDKLQAWLDSRSAAVGKTNWDSHDGTVKLALVEIEQHIASFGKASKLDWRIIKAMLWVETGAENAQWKSKPMQIGVTGDPGLDDFLDKKRPGVWITPPSWSKKLTKVAVLTTPEWNIRAGMGYLLMRMGQFIDKTFDDPADPGLVVEVKRGDTLNGIARKHGSTQQSVEANNPSLNPKLLRPGVKVRVVKSELRKVLTGWKTFDAQTIADHYNGNQVGGKLRGDPNYAVKLAHCMKLLGAS